MSCIENTSMAECENSKHMINKCDGKRNEFAL